MLTLQNCETLLRSGRHEAISLAVNHLQQIVSKTPQDPIAWHMLGNAAGLLGNLELSEQLLNMALSLTPEHDRGPIWNSLGRLYAMLRRADEAVHAYEKALALGGAGTAALVNLMQAKLRSQDYAACQAIYQKARELGFDHRLLASNMMAASLQQGLFADALQFLADLSVDPIPTDPELLEHLSIAHQLGAAALGRLGRFEEGAKAMREAFALRNQAAAIRQTTASQMRQPPATPPFDRLERPQSYHFACIFWGESFRRRFLECLVAVHLSPRNAAALRRIPAVFRLSTTCQDADALTQDCRFQALQQLVRVEINLIDTSTLEQTGSYDLFTKFHEEAIRHAQESKAALLPLFPDALFNDGYLDFVIAQMERGKRAVMYCVPRVDEDRFQALLDASDARRPDGSLVLTSRQIVDWSTQSFHPIARSLFRDQPELLGGGPYHLYWSLPDGGWLARAFVAAPLCIFPVVPVRNLPSTIDMYFARQAVPDIQDIVLVTDSDDVVAIDLAPAAVLRDYRRIERHHASYCELREMWWVEMEADSHHRHYVQHDILFHTGDVTAASNPVRAEAARVVAKLSTDPRELFPPPSSVNAKGTSNGCPVS